MTVSCKNKKFIKKSKSNKQYIFVKRKTKRNKKASNIKNKYVRGGGNTSLNTNNIVGVGTFGCAFTKGNNIIKITFFNEESENELKINLFLQTQNIGHPELELSKKISIISTNFSSTKSPQIDSF